MTAPIKDIRRTAIAL